MAARYVRKLAVLAKIETTYADDALPTGAADAMLMTEVTLTPMAGGEESRELLLPYLGNQGVVLTGEHVILEGSIEVAGAGTAGDVPGYGAMLRACGLAETVTAGTSVEYTPISSGFEAATIYYNLDGVQHVMLGARGNVSVELTPQRIPRFRFRMIGMSGTITDKPLPTVDFAVFQTPVVVNKANTSLSLHGFVGPTERISLDLGNSVEPRLLIGWESAEITDRKSSGSATIEAAKLAVKDWFEIARTRQRGALQLTHGKVAGNIVEFLAPAVEIGRPTQGSAQGVANYTTPLSLCPVDGNDELVISVK